MIKYFPILESKFRKVKRSVGKSWKVDETYIKVKGHWVYYYRAVDKDGQTIDFYLSPTRDAEAARLFFEKAIGSSGCPEKVNINKSGANLASLQHINSSLPKDQNIMIRQVKYLNNRVEQDHRAIKRKTKPMMGFKNFVSAAETLTGIELAHMIKKGQGLWNQTLSFWEQFYCYCRIIAFKI